MKRPHRAGPYLVLIASLLLTLATALLVASVTRARDAARFEHAVDGANDRITGRLLNYETLLRAGAAFVSASQDVRVGEFETWVERFRLGERYPGIQGVGYTERIVTSTRDSIIAAQRAGRFPDFRIWPAAAPGEEEHTIVYLFPLDERNAAAIGYNMHSEETRRAAMDAARDSGSSALSGRVTLVQEIAGRTQAGFLIYAPVYGRGAIPGTLAERRELLRGFVYAPFRADDLFEGIFGSEELPHVAFRVYDGISTNDSSLLHDSRLQGIAPSSSPHFSTTDTLRIAGRQWTVAFNSTPAFESETRQQVWLLVLLLGTAASVAIFLVLLRQVAARGDAESLALRLQATTRELEDQVEEVKSLNAEVQHTNRELADTNRALRMSNERLVTLREEADQARDDARQANQAKSDFLAAMSHELRTPLNAIMGYAEILELEIHGPINPKQRQSLERIRRSQVHLLGLINDVLNYAKLEAGKVHVRRDTVPLWFALADLRAMTEPQVHERKLQAEFQRCPRDIAAVGDADKIQQILLNLLTNAIKFTDPGGMISVSCSADEDEVIVRVADTGHGIPSDRLDAIFDPFVQVDRSGGHDGRHGVGLGLAISRDLAQLMGGELSVESEVGRGSVFTLRLPRAAAGVGAR